MKKMRKVIKIFAIALIFSLTSTFFVEATNDIDKASLEEFMKSVALWEHPTIKLKERLDYKYLTRGTYSNSINAGGVRYVKELEDGLKIRYEMDRYITKSQDALLNEVMRDISKILLEGIDDEREKIKLLVEWIARNIKYGDGGSDISPHSVYRIIDGGEGYCQVYASSFQLLAEMNGIDSVYTVGMVPGRGLHAWNMIKIDDEWYGVDPTWHNPGNKIIMTYDEMSRERVVPPKDELEEKLWNVKIHRKYYRY